MADTGRKRTTDKEGLKGKQRTYKREILAALFIILLVIGVAFRVNQIFYGFDLPEIAFAGSSVAETETGRGRMLSGSQMTGGWSSSTGIIRWKTHSGEN